MVQARRLTPALLLLALLLTPFSPATASPQPQVPKPILLTDPVPDPHQSGVQWFVPTGHTLRGIFLDYWTRYGGLAQFGYPLTEEFFEPSGPSGQQLQVQYFQRNRFEHHPENAGTPYEVLLGTLGRAFHPADPPAPQLLPPARYYPSTGHNLSGAFLAYWDTHGGLFVHGYPLTEPIEESNPVDGKRYTVQYFERSRFEHHPENAGSPYEVLLGLLGTQLAQKQGYPYGWYPQYGHAADFSWVAGELAHPGQCWDPACYCPRFYYRVGPGSSSQYVGGPAYRAVLEAYMARKAPIFGVPLILFVHSPSPNEHDPACPLDYIVDKVQANPAQ